MNNHTDNTLPKKYIARQISKNIQSDNPESLKQVLDTAGVPAAVCDKQINNHIKARYLPQLREEFAKQGLTNDKIKGLLNERYAGIYDIAMDGEINKKNLDLQSAKYALDGIARLNNIVKDSNINTTNVLVVDSDVRNLMDKVFNKRDENNP